MNELMLVVANAGQAPAAGPGGLLGGMPIVPIVFLFAIFYFMILRPQQRRDKERRSMLEQLKTGANVIFGGGIKGTVTNIKDDEVLVVRIADNVKIEILRDSVSRIIEKGEKVSDEKRS